MKAIKFFLYLSILSVVIFSCTPDNYNLSNQEIDSSELDLVVYQPEEGANSMILMGDERYISYWQYFDSEFEELGDSNEHTDTINLPFAGTYYVLYTAFTKSGAVVSDTLQVQVSDNDPDFFDKQEWELLTGGELGKTWVLNMDSPIGWAGFDFPFDPDGDDYWNWYPDYSGNEWVMENRDWGEVTFDLDGGYNIEVKQYDDKSGDFRIANGTYNYSIAQHNIKISGAELLYGGDYYPDVSNWKTIEVFELTETSLRLAVVRDQDRDGEDDAYIVFHYKPKQE